MLAVTPRLRPLAPDDESLLWTALYHALHVPPGAPVPPPGAVREPEIARYVAGWMARPGDLGVAVEVGEATVGAAWLRRWSRDNRGFGFVSESVPELAMALLPGFRGRGLGTLLLRHLLEVAAREARAVSLSVSLSNPARRLYERAGFERWGAPTGGSVTLVRRLRDAPEAGPAAERG